MTLLKVPRDHVPAVIVRCALFLVLSIGLPAADAKSSSLPIVRIGVIDHAPVPSVHNMPYRGGLIDAAITLALSDWEASPTTKRYHFDIVRYYYGDNAIDAVPAVRDALAGDTVAAIGLTSSEHAMIAAPLLQGTSYTVISPYASAHSLLSYRPNILLMDDPTTVEAQAIAQFIESELRPAKPLAIVAWDSAYSKDLYAALPENIRRRFHLVKVLNDSQYLQPIITQVLQYQPDLIFLPVFGVFAGHMVKAIVAGGYHGVFVGGQSWGETNGKAFQLITQGMDFQGYEIRMPSRYFPSPQHQQFAARVEREFPMTFSPLVANLYDGLHFLFSQINTLTTAPTRRTVQARIQRERSFPGIMGKKCLFDEWCAPRTYSVVAVDGNGFRPYTQFVVAEIKPRSP